MASVETDTEEKLAPGEQRLGTAAIIMVVATFGSALAGLIRAMVYSREFGTTPAFNAYLQAFRIPDLSYFLIAGGVLRAGFIPVFTKFTATGHWDKAWKTFSITFYVMVVVGALAVAGGMIGAPWLARRVVAPGLEPYYQDLCGRFMRTMFPAQLFFIVGGLLMGTLNARRHFTMPAWGPIIYNVVIIVGALASLPIAVRNGVTEPQHQLVYRLWVLSLFVVVGAAIGNVAMQIPPLMRMGTRLEAYFDLRDEGLKNLILLSLPVILGLAVNEIDFMVSTIIGTHISDRAVSLLDYPNRLVKLPPRIFGAGLAIALFPVLATHYAKGKMAEYRRDLGLIMRSTMFLSIPSTIVAIALASPIIRMFFEGKAFSAADTHDAAQVLIWSAIGIAPLSLQYIVARGFYALHETKIPLWVGLATVAVDIVLSLLAYKPFGVAGLSGATSLAGFLNAIVLAWLLKRRVGLLEGRRMATMMVRMTVPTIVLGVICFGGAQTVARHFPAERKVALARPALLQLANEVQRRRLTPEAALQQAQRAVAEAGATDYVKLEADARDFAWYEKSLSGPVKMLACLGPMALSIVVFLGLCVLFKVEEMQSAINLATARFRRSKPSEPPATLSQPDDPA